MHLPIQNNLLRFEKYNKKHKRGIDEVAEMGCG